MKHKGTFSLGISLLSVGLGIVALEKTTLPSLLSVRQYEFLSYAIIAFGLLLIIVDLIFYASYFFWSTKRKVQDKLERIFEYELDFFQPDLSDLPQINELMDEILGKARTSTLPMIRRFYEANPKSFFCISKISQNTRQGKLLAFFMLFPLNKAAHDLIQQGIMPTGRQLQDDHINGSLNKAYGIYIGAIVAKTRHGKAYALHLLHREIMSTLKNNNNVKALYARPGTSDGERLLKKHGFKAISKESEIWTIDAKEVLHNPRDAQ